MNRSADPSSPRLRQAKKRDGCCRSLKFGLNSSFRLLFFVPIPHADGTNNDQRQPEEQPQHQDHNEAEVETPLLCTRTIVTCSTLSICLLRLGMGFLARFRSSDLCNWDATWARETVNAIAFTWTTKLEGRIIVKTCTCMVRKTRVRVSKRVLCASAGALLRSYDFKTRLWFLWYNVYV